MTRLFPLGHRGLAAAIVLVAAFMLPGCETPGKVGTTTTFEASAADQADIGKALERDGKVTLRGVLFETDSDKLSADGLAAGARLAEVMTQNQALKVAVVGHTDNTGAFRYNLSLSERRARSLANELIRKGVARDRVASVGVGSLDPVASDDTPEGRAMNRRVDVVLIE